MLVLTRRTSEGLVIGNEIEIVINKARSGKVSFGIKAPKHVKVLRAELNSDLAKKR